MRRIDEAAIKRYADLRFRSEYGYALFEYYRSAKVIAFPERVGVRVGGRVLDASCGGGGMPLSFAEEANETVGIDLKDRFRDAGARLARERQARRLSFLVAPTGCISRSQPACSTWCCRTRSSSTWPMLYGTFRNARAC